MHRKTLINHTEMQHKISREVKPKREIHVLQQKETNYLQNSINQMSFKFLCSLPEISFVIPFFQGQRLVKFSNQSPLNEGSYSHYQQKLLIFKDLLINQCPRRELNKFASKKQTRGIEIYILEINIEQILSKRWRQISTFKFQFNLKSQRPDTPLLRKNRYIAGITRLIYQLEMYIYHRNRQNI